MAAWDAIGAVSILNDIVIVLLPMWLLHDSQMPLTKKLSVMIAFTGRIL